MGCFTAEYFLPGERGNVDFLPVEALREYRDGERDHELMRTVARSLGQAEMEALAAYFEQVQD